MNKICIVRTTYYDRSPFLQLSLEYQHLADYASNFETYIFVDPHPKYEYIPDYDDVITSEYRRINWSRNSGKYNWYDAIKYIFKNTNYDYVISIEDDIIISKDYLRLCKQLALHDEALCKNDDILYFHSGGLANCRSNEKDINKIVSSSAASRSILIYREKFKIIDEYIKNNIDNFVDNDNVLQSVLNEYKMKTIAPDYGRDGHFGIYGWSSNGVDKNMSGQKSIFKEYISPHDLYKLLKDSCLNKEKLLALNQYKNPDYFWNFDPNISFQKLYYRL